MNSTDTPAASPIGLLRPILALMTLGALVVLSMIPVVIGELESLSSSLPGYTPGAVIALTLFNSFLPLLPAVILGTLAARRVGLTSYIVECIRFKVPVWPRLKPHIPLAVLLGTGFILFSIVLDLLIHPDFAVRVSAGGAQFLQLFQQLSVGLLYGGITEELLLRWGIMSSLAWVFWKLCFRRRGFPPEGVFAAAIAVSDLLFGLGHLPALAAQQELTALIVTRTVLLNSIGGIIFGWLFWTRGLETAMVAHGSSLVLLFIINGMVLLML